MNKALLSSLAILAGTALGCVGVEGQVELVTLNADTWDDYAPHGKEVDAIYGDFVLRNDRLIAVIANPIPGRRANLTTGENGGWILDLTTRDDPNDQLVSFSPGGGRTAYRFGGIEADGATTLDIEDRSRVEVRADAVTLSVKAPGVENRYTLRSGEPWIRIETIYTRGGGQADLIDHMRAERTFARPKDGPTDLAWVYDRYFGQAYGVVADTDDISYRGDGPFSFVSYVRGGSSKVPIPPGGSVHLSRRLFPGRNLIEVKSIAAQLGGSPLRDSRVIVRDGPKSWVPAADVTLKRDGLTWASGRTGENGMLEVAIPEGTYQLTVSALGNGSRNGELRAGSVAKIMLERAGTVEAEISDVSGGPIPCKVQFLGRDGTRNPHFGPDSGDHGVRNVFYTHDGRFVQKLPPGSYDVIVSYGPEYDAVFTHIDVRRGAAAALRATLRRTVDTSGWVSSDFHSHSSPSGDNVSSQLGRVLNLLCENIEFAPCTEHNRLSTYEPHLRRLGATHLMATCVGIELTGAQGSLNHQNAFPLILKPHTQDGGAPRITGNPLVQIERLALWDGGSEKLVQVDHPNIIQMFFDGNLDGAGDPAFAKMAGFMDVIEVHPIFQLLQPPEEGTSRIVTWLQLLNQGYRIPGVINSDAHYNFHGSGWRRNYLKSPTDDPAKIRTRDMVAAAEAGHVIMSTGPFMEVQLKSSKTPSAGPGDDASAPDRTAELHVRVQTSNQFDVDRVQVFLNGRPEPSLNFTRLDTPRRFGDGVTAFDQTIKLRFREDTHVIVAAAGMRSRLGPVVGPNRQHFMPIALSNPIFVDVDGNGFKANGDALDHPLPKQQ